jgi:pimeloyl-ACP methyl ester carboxylesterase
MGKKPTKYNRANLVIRLHDGRRLGYADYGDPAGKPIFYFSGGIGSRLQAAPAETQPLIPGVRLIGVDRPGLGLSDFQPGRRIVDWPDDVRQLADALSLKQFAVLGVSAGGPYALSCACKIPDRLTGCGLVAGALPPERIGGLRWMYELYHWFPWVMRFVYWWTTARYVGKDERQWEALVTRPVRISHAYPPSDRALWSDPALRRRSLMERLEAFRQGTRGPVYEAGLWGQPWGFRVEEISFRRIFVWHGELDRIVPAPAVRAMLEKLPSSEAKFYPRDGHSVGSYHWEEILRRMAE